MSGWLIDVFIVVGGVEPHRETDPSSAWYELATHLIDPMPKNPLNKGMIQENSTGIGEVSSEMLADRADELALIAGRPVNMKDSAQARRELTGGNSMEPKQAWLESISEDERGEPMPSPTGHQAQESDSETEDENGQSRSAQIYEEGVSEAGHDQMLEAARAAKAKDKPGQSSRSNDHSSHE